MMGALLTGMFVAGTLVPADTYIDARIPLGPPPDHTELSVDRNRVDTPHTPDTHTDPAGPCGTGQELPVLAK